MGENLFIDRAAAVRYARSRPDVTRPVIERLRSALATPVRLAVDVGCGTGQSTRALRALATRVVGIDASLAMIAAAEPLDGIDYAVGRAEALPVCAGGADLVTAGLSMHWFDRDAFLAEARRVLAPGGHLALWNAGCAGRGEPGADAWAWFGGPYQRAFPAPARDARPLDDESARGAGFAPVLRDRFAVDVLFDHDAFVEFLTTQSNVLDAVRSDATALAATRDRLRRETAVFFTDGPRGCRFDGWLSIFVRS
jgi:SAM-dependent methyltransferase